VIFFEAVAARRPPMALGSFTAQWGSGVHAVVGAPQDGGPLLLALAAGDAPARAGRVQVLGGAPADRRVRTQVAFVPLEPPLPDGLRVREVLALAAAVRGEPPRDPLDRLAVLGLGPLAPRMVRSLSADEARAVALAEAVTSSRVRVLLVDEPLVQMDPRAVARVPELLRDRAREGCAVLVATASLRDAGELADDHLLLRGGALAGRADSLTQLSTFVPDGVRVRVVTNDVQALLAAAAREEAVVAVSRHDGAIVARGEDAMALAAAVGRAIVASGVGVTEMCIEPPPLEPARAAAAGMAAAAYDAAYARTRSTLADPPATQSASDPPPPDARRTPADGPEGRRTTSSP
jgi:ABC-2 type transport system ATP-binding protein